MVLRPLRSPPKGKGNLNMNTLNTDIFNDMGPGSVKDPMPLGRWGGAMPLGAIRFAFERGRELRGLDAYRNDDWDIDTKPEGEEITDSEFSLLARWDNEGGLL